MTLSLQAGLRLVALKLLDSIYSRYEGAALDLVVGRDYICNLLIGLGVMHSTFDSALSWPLALKNLVKVLTLAGIQYFFFSED